MKNYLCLVVLLFSLSLTFSQTPTMFSAGEENRISAVGVGSKTTFPNAATISMSVRFVKPTLREAMNENQKTTKEILTIVKKYVSDTTEVKVSLIYTDKEFTHNQKLDKSVFVGFESSQKIIFTLKDLAKMQDFTEEVLKTKIHEIERVSYFHTDAAVFMKEAQELAVEDAMENTQRLAKSGKIKLGKIIYLQTNTSPASANSITTSSGSLRTYNKGMGGEGVSASGQLLTYTANVTMHTKIE